jgi:hypothetical protein
MVSNGGFVSGVHLYQGGKGEEHEREEAPETAVTVRHAGTVIGYIGTGVR